MLRERAPNIKIGWFLHTPFPSSEIYRTLPRRKEILRGVLAADLVGFHIYDYVRHFLTSCNRILGTEISQENKYIFDNQTRHTVTVDAFPIGIDPDKFAGSLRSVAVKDRIIALQRRFDGQRVILGIDRLDYVKGIPHKLLALEKFLTDHPEWIGKVVLVQVAVPSRTNVVDYQKLKNQVHKLVGRIQGKFGTLMDVPIHYIDQSIGQVELTAIYNIADVLMVTSLRDGMNLVSFEYIACQEQNHGVLILSEMAGAAQGLGAGAMLVNPFNTDEIAQALHDGLNMGRAEREQRHGYMHQYITKYTSQYWAENFVSDLRHGALQSDLPQFESVASASAVLSKSLQDPEKSRVLGEYQSSETRLIILGLLGTLMSYEEFEEGHGPSDEVLEALAALCADSRNTVVVISGRERALMNEWLGSLPIWLVAENGLFHRCGGREKEWVEYDEDLDCSWMDSVKPVFKYFEVHACC